jgi:antitoxin component of RelBE/YafQ-DinJ toxin-antitoxin module
MTKNSVVRARIDARTKRQAAAAPPLNPNAETVSAMKAARRGEVVKAGKPDKLLRSLGDR